MNHSSQEVILQATGADALYHIEDIQWLWSGYGKIMRYGLRGADRERVVVKHVKLPDQHHHPRGWNTDRAHQRKIRSYVAEIQGHSGDNTGAGATRFRERYAYQ